MHGGTLSDNEESSMMAVADPPFGFQGAMSIKPKNQAGRLNDWRRTNADSNVNSNSLPEDYPWHKSMMKSASSLVS